jgi:hypothetical protein
MSAEGPGAKSPPSAAQFQRTTTYLLKQVPIASFSALHSSAALAAQRSLTPPAQLMASSYSLEQPAPSASVSAASQVAAQSAFFSAPSQALPSSHKLSHVAPQPVPMNNMEEASAIIENVFFNMIFVSLKWCPPRLNASSWLFSLSLQHEGEHRLLVTRPT